MYSVSIILEHFGLGILPIRHTVRPSSEAGRLGCDAGRTKDGGGCLNLGGVCSGVLFVETK